MESGSVGKLSPSTQLAAMTCPADLSTVNFYVRSARHAYKHPSKLTGMRRRAYGRYAALRQRSTRPPRGADMSRPQWAPDDIDVSRPNAARIYDYFLGGTHNFAVDRQLGDQVLAVMSDGPSQALANRQFMQRAVTYCVDAGIRQ